MGDYWGNEYLITTKPFIRNIKLNVIFIMELEQFILCSFKKNKPEFYIHCANVVIYIQFKLDQYDV